MFKIEISLNETNKISVIVRPITNKKKIFQNNHVNNIDNILYQMELEKVELSDILPKFIKTPDYLLEQTCTVCHEKYKKTEFTRTLKCNHSFHKKCIDKWLKKTPNCPCCRDDLI